MLREKIVVLRMILYKDMSVEDQMADRVEDGLKISWNGPR